MKFIITFLFFFLISITFAQKNVSGVIKNQKTGEPIPFVNLGILGGNLGTVSDEIGNFILQVPLDYKQGKFVISSIGYKKITFNSLKEFVESIMLSSIVLMEEEVGTLNEVVVHAQKNKFKKNKKRVKYKFALGFDNGVLGKEFAVKEFVEESSVLDFIEINLVENENDTFFFRINIYDSNEGIPSIKIKSIYVELTDYHEGDFSIDLSSYNIKVEKEYFISIECIKKSNKIMFRASEGVSYFRAVSLDSWKNNVFKLDCKVFYK